MSYTTSKLNDEQRKLCHELTMEFIRQNDSLKMKRDEDGKFKKETGEKIRKIYFSIYNTLAVGVLEHWDEIQ